MNPALAAAAVLTFAMGVAHSALGERYIIVRLLRRDDLPRILGSDGFTRMTIRYAWHVTTIAWWGLAAILMVISGALTGLNVARGVVLSVAWTFAATAVLALVVTRGRHLSWVVCLAVAVLCLGVVF